MLILFCFFFSDLAPQPLPAAAAQQAVGAVDGQNVPTVGGRQLFRLTMALDAAEAERDDARAEIVELKKKIEELEKTARAEIVELQKKIEELEKTK